MSRKAWYCRSLSLHLHGPTNSNRHAVDDPGKEVKELSIVPRR